MVLDVDVEMDLAALTWPSPSRRRASALPSSTADRPWTAPTRGTRRAPSLTPRPEKVPDRAHDVDAQAVGDVVALEVLAERRGDDVVVYSALLLGVRGQELGCREQPERRRRARVVALDEREQPGRGLGLLARRERDGRGRAHVGSGVAERRDQDRHDPLVLDGRERLDGPAAQIGRAIARVEVERIDGARIPERSQRLDGGLEARRRAAHAQQIEERLDRVRRARLPQGLRRVDGPLLVVAEQDVPHLRELLGRQLGRLFLRLGDRRLLQLLRRLGRLRRARGDQHRHRR